MIVVAVAGIHPPVLPLGTCGGQGTSAAVQAHGRVYARYAMGCGATAGAMGAGATAAGSTAAGAMGAGAGATEGRATGATGSGSRDSGHRSNGRDNRSRGNTGRSSGRRAGWTQAVCLVKVVRDAV